MYIKVVKAGSIVIMLFLIIYLGTLIGWVFNPLIVFVRTLFVPMLIAGILFYLLRPIVLLLHKKMSKGLSIVLLFVGLFGLGFSFLSLIGPEIERQFRTLIASTPTIVSELQLLMLEIQQSELGKRFGVEELFNWEGLLEQIGMVLGGFIGELVATGFGFIGTLFNVLVLVFIVPFILFYMLKEGDRLPQFFLNFMDKEKQTMIRPILKNMDQTLSSYIQGVLLVCMFIGVLYYICFSVIGLEYALILAIVGMVTNLIPYVGPWIGAIPSFIVALIQSPVMAISVLIIVVVIQQIESIFVQPQVIGRKLSIHPVTVMALVLVAGRFVGVAGMVLVIPTYAIVKVVVTHFYRIWKVKENAKIV
ncbi:hypothetical protein JCM9140_2345 [Halalkalibacter wakoensis JCM 9140]|uniref:Uncharacterized protein n=1 Tax=Halalkalibacter wakoensis JCM 9140 TaxID=1236970 RepID=W4Q2I5_9BACI|nr:AI-2E family transporter [Halalkalibacter wakoensis]GAE26296.1 hypothetical protein JCM9140_2345 [Halalkalibacter wakoensis JCM 9140]